jgi:hypothetical protein
MTGVFPGWRIFLFLDKFVNASGKVANPQDTQGIITMGLTDPVEISAGILEQSMEARNRVGTELSYWPASQCSLASRYDNPIPSRLPRAKTPPHQNTTVCSRPCGIKKASKNGLSCMEYRNSF